MQVFSRSYGVMAITLDFESNNPSSNLGRTFNFWHLYRFKVIPSRVQVSPDLNLEQTRPSNSLFSNLFIVVLFSLQTYRTKRIINFFDEFHWCIHFAEMISVYPDWPSRIVEKWVWNSVLFQFDLRNDHVMFIDS